MAHAHKKATNKTAKENDVFLDWVLSIDHGRFGDQVK